MNSIWGCCGLMAGATDWELGDWGSIPLTLGFALINQFQ